MRSANSSAGRALRGVVLAASAFASIAPALAGGPLYIVPSGGTLQPARWQGTVQVYTDQGDLGAADNATANQLVANAIGEWSSVPTSTFRARIAGTLATDITGANAGTVIGADNGGGIQVIYDHDGSVLADFFGAGYGVLGIATPEYLAAEGSTQIVEGWMVLKGEEDFEIYREWFPDMQYSPGEPTSGIVTHEFGHAINLAHTQTNGSYAQDQGYPQFGGENGPDEAGPEQCGKAVAGYPSAEQIETMYPYINPFPFSDRYNSPQFATVNVADDAAALSSIYPTAGYAATTGTLKGRVVAKDGTSELTGINVIARRVDQGNPFDAMSRISGDLTQGYLGPDGDFVMTGLVPGASYVVYIDELNAGGFSTPKAILLGPEEYWNANESGDASVDDACASTPITLAAGEVRTIQVAVNGIPRAPTFTHIPYVLGANPSDNGQRIAGVYSNWRSPFWLWDKQNGTSYLGGEGFFATISGNGRVVGGSVAVETETEYGPVPQQRAALWTRERGWQMIPSSLPGCDIFQMTLYDLSTNGSIGVGLAFPDCRDSYAFKWDARSGVRLLSKASEGQQCQDPWSGETYDCEGNARANGVSGTGAVVVGWEEIPEAQGLRVGSIWQRDEQMLLRDPGGDNPFGGWVGAVQAVNTAGTIAVGGESGPQANEAYQWTPTTGVTSLGRLQGQACFDSPWGETCSDLDTRASSVSDDGKVITGESFAGGAIYTRKMGWMLLADFLDKQGVLEAAQLEILGARVSADGKTLAGTANHLAAEYFQGFRLELDQVFVCHGKGSRAQTLRLGFPDAMDLHLSHGDTVGFCPGQGPL